jgi:hypothetical protein
MGLLGLLAARNRADDVFTQRRRRHCETRKPNIAEALRDAVQRCAASAHHQHPLVLADERADRVDDGLGASRAGQGAHDDRVAGSHLGNDILLL